MEVAVRVATVALAERRASVSHANAVRSWNEREGVILEVRGGGAVGLGEASPLPGYSRDDLESCRRELAVAARLLEDFEVETDPRAALRAATTRAEVRSPAAVFAVETALLDLLAQHLAEPAWAVLRGDRGARPIPLSALAEGATAEALADSVGAALERGIATVKIKVGGEGGDARDRERLHVVRERVGDGVALRLDANQTFPVAEVGSRMATLSRFSPELVEEPTSTEHWIALPRLPVPVAMDESLAREGWEARLTTCAAKGTVAAVVLKPTALGGLLRCLDVAETAARAGLAIVVTHTFDGPIAAASAACLALAIHGRVLPCGLDAHARLERDVLPIGRTHVLPFTEAGIGARP